MNPTQAQIEAATRAIHNRLRQPFKLSETSERELAEAALTAAAEVGEKERIDDIETKLQWARNTAEIATIERCAQVAHDWLKHHGYAIEAIECAAAICALKDKPLTDPNIIYPGKDLTNVFPEET